MTVTPELIRALVNAELARIGDAQVQSHARSLLVEPVVVRREWDYGAPDEAYPCWAVLSHATSNSGIAYCEHGFGPRTPWGLVSLSGPYMSMGMDSGWFASLADAYFDSFAATELPIWQIFKQTDDNEYPGTPLTAASDWTSTWAEVYRLRAADPTARYHCMHRVAVVGGNGSS
jgi:hypothetical protein